MLLDTDTPVSAFAKVRRGPFAFLLESAPAGSETWSRYTYLGTEPRARGGCGRDGTVEDWTPDRGWHGARRPRDPLGDLQALVAKDVPVAVPELGDFWAGAVGYFGYDVVRHFERLPAPAVPRTQCAGRDVRVHGRVVIMDNLRAQARVVVGVPVPAGATEATLRAALRHSGPRSGADAGPATGLAAAPRARSRSGRGAGHGAVDVRPRQVSRQCVAHPRIHPRR